MKMLTFIDRVLYSTWCLAYFQCFTGFSLCLRVFPSRLSSVNRACGLIFRAQGQYHYHSSLLLSIISYFCCSWKLCYIKEWNTLWFFAFSFSYRLRIVWINSIFFWPFESDTLPHFHNAFPKFEHHLPQFVSAMTFF